MASLLLLLLLFLFLGMMGGGLCETSSTRQGVYNRKKDSEELPVRRHAMQSYDL
jgi:hypothetical protein